MVVFISYNHQDEFYFRIVEKIFQQKGIEYKAIDPSDVGRASNPDYIAQKLRDIIRDCDTMAVIVTHNTNDSNWVNWEISQAVKNDLRVVGIESPDCNPETDTPESLNDFGDGSSGLNADDIEELINGENSWKKQSGEEREPIASLSHSDC